MNVNFVSLLLRLLGVTMDSAVVSFASSLLLHLTTCSRNNRVICSQSDIPDVAIELFEKSASSLDIKILCEFQRI